MPELSRFYGIIISMYFKDHSPPHFHVRYGEYKAFFDIPEGELIEGNLPRSARRLVEAWVELHREELMENWEESQKKYPKLKKIEPLR